MNAHDRAVASFEELVGKGVAPDFVARAPGRVNLIGEHTDYNDGFTLPMALPFDTVVAFGSHDAEEGVVEIVSNGFGELRFDPRDDPRTSVPEWARHIAGAAHLLHELGVDTGGWRAAIDTDIPTGASLSSSAALEVAVISALLHRAGVQWTPLEIAQLGQRVENEVVGLPSGIMDQYISAGAVAGHASLMDCRSLTLTPVPLPDGVSVAVMDTGTRRVLAEAAYAERRAACERAVAVLGVPALRDATLDMVATISDDEARRRAGHVVAENARALTCVDAFRANDLDTVGQLLDASHVSLRDDYEVSGPGLDAIVEVAWSAPGCVGARMTGGGFAGCAVALVRSDDAEQFTQAVLDGYAYDGHQATVWMCDASAGASIVT